MRPAPISPFAGWDLHRLIDTQAARRGDATWMIWEPFEGEGLRWSHRAFAETIRRFAAGLQARGVRPGQRILVHLENCPEAVIAWLGCAYAGAVAVTTNTRAMADEIAYAAVHSQAVGAVTQPPFSRMMRSAAPQLAWIVATDADAGAGAAPEAETSAEPFTAPDADPADLADRPHDLMAPFAIQYTSGTTARPKAVLWTQCNGLWGARERADRGLVTVSSAERTTVTDRPNPRKDLWPVSGPWARLSRVLVALGLGVVTATATGCASLLTPPGGYVDPWHEKVQAAGYVHKTALINGITLSYVEGPDNGPPLVLLHAQFLDWFSYSRVLPALSKHFHVYDIDYPGHGETITPADYPMTADRIGADLGDFIAREIGQPVYITGNSSGGLLTVWLAANRPELVRAALLEDPPLFASEYPRIRQTVAYRAFRTSDAATRDHPDDFLLYWIQGNAGFFRKQIGPGSPALLTALIRAQRRARPGQPPEIGLIPNDTVRMLLRGLDSYDPRFGAAFYTGTWNAGFDHAEALRRIICPVLLIQADTSTLEDGTLDGAMSPEEAQRAASLLRRGDVVKVDATHVVNLDKPDQFIRAVETFFLGEERQER